MKTVKQEEPISRSRFADCPVCKNRTLKLKRVVQVGRCKTCNETYKIVVVYVKTGRKAKTADLGSHSQTEKTAEIVAEPTPTSSGAPSDTSLLVGSTPDYSGFSSALFGDTRSDRGSEAGSSGSQ